MVMLDRSAEISVNCYGEPAASGEDEKFEVCPLQAAPAASV